MLEKIIQCPRALRRHQNAPLRKEREEFLAHLARGGRKPRKLIDVSAYLLRFIARTRFRRMRRVHLSKIRQEAEKWRRRDPNRLPKIQAKNHFFRYAKAWLKFHNKLIEPQKWNEPRDRRVKAFAKYLAVELGFQKRTIENRIWALNRFLRWLDEGDLRLDQLTLAEIERYIDSKAAFGWGASTIAVNSQYLKVFFRFAERQRWCRRGLSRGIFGPVLERRTSNRKGPAWIDVLRLIESFGGGTADGLRSRAALLLLATYALRASEVYNLRISDVNLDENILTIRRSKNHLTQRFEIMPEVREALKDYLHKGRPNSRCTCFFLKLRRPYGPIQQSSLYKITKKMKKLGISSMTYGPHSIRHACATHLLTSGTPVKHVANLLGHTTTRFIGHYAKHSVDELRAVADVDLVGLCAAL
jgi:integrase/recombinase XerD